MASRTLDHCVIRVSLGSGIGRSHRSLHVHRSQTAREVVTAALAKYNLMQADATRYSLLRLCARGYVPIAAQDAVWPIVECESCTQFIIEPADPPSGARAVFARIRPRSHGSLSRTWSTDSYSTTDEDAVVRGSLV